MCGIYGFIGKKYLGFEKDIIAMSTSLKHRGPDFSNSLVISKFDFLDIVLGHNRLSIIDLTFSANQPMKSHSNRYTIIFNGEIYNYKEIKNELNFCNPNINWNSNSDTEVLLQAIEFWGVKESIPKLVGMFAISIWDDFENKFYLIRDRIGEKPLFYGYQNGYLIFASELVAFYVHSKFENKINYKSAIDFLKKSYVSGESSIYDQIFKVKPGTILEFDVDSIKNLESGQEFVYWSLSDFIHKSIQNPFKGSYLDAVNELELLLKEAVKAQAISDVPLGSFLSGGIDSSLVTALLQNSLSDNRLKTFTIGMPFPGKNEAPFAEAIAKDLNTDHYTLYLNTEDIVKRIEEIISKWDEPFGDSSQIPTFFVSEYAKEKVTVVLSGDGADEFLYGYADQQFYDKYKKFTFLLKFKFDKFVEFISLIPSLKSKRIVRKFNTLFSLLRLFQKHNNLGIIHSNWHNKFRDFSLPINSNLLSLMNVDSMDFLNEDFNYSGYYDALSYLPNDILVKVDRASMSKSLETRAPFLDHRVIEFIVSLPKEFKIKNSITKRITRDILYKYVPEERFNRPKQGFSIPLSFWLKNELRSWSENLLNSIPSDSEFWNSRQIQLLWEEHINNVSDHSEKLWNILMLEHFFKRRKIFHHS